MKDCPSFALYLIESGSVEIYSRLYTKGSKSTSEGQRSARGNPNLSWSEVSRTKSNGDGEIMPLATLHPGDVMGELELFANGDNQMDHGALNRNYAVAGVNAKRATASGVDDNDLNVEKADAKEIMIDLIAQQEVEERTHVKYLLKRDVLDLFQQFEDAGTILRADIETFGAGHSRHKSVHEHTAFWTYPMENNDGHAFPDGHPLHNDKLRYTYICEWSCTLIVPTVGVLPFFIPLAVNEHVCSASSNNGGSWLAEAGVAVCVEMDVWGSIAVQSIWWLGTTLFLFEFLRIQFGTIGFGKTWWPYIFCVVAPSLTNGLFEWSEIFAVDECEDSVNMVVSSLSCGVLKRWGAATLKVLLSGWPQYTTLIYYTSKQYFDRDLQKSDSTLGPTPSKTGDAVAAHEHKSGADELSAPTEKHETAASVPVVELLGGNKDVVTTAGDERNSNGRQNSDRRKQKKKRRNRPAEIKTIDKTLGEVVTDLKPDIKHRDIARRWRDRSRRSTNAKKAMVRSALWLISAIFIVIANWIWLQLFVGLYNESEVTALHNVYFSVLFIISESVLRLIMKHVVKKAEEYRLGTRQTTFDRYQLVNLITMAFSIYTAVYRQSLFVKQTDFVEFIALAIPSVILEMMLYRFKMTDWWALSDRYPELQSRWRQATRNSKYDHTWESRTVWCGQIPRELAVEAHVRDAFSDLNLGRIEDILVKVKDDDGLDRRSWAVVTFEEETDAARAVQAASLTSAASLVGGASSLFGVVGVVNDGVPNQQLPWVVTKINPEKKEKLQADMSRGWQQGKLVACVISILHCGDMAKPDVTNNRGEVCFREFLSTTAVWIASIQYLAFLLLLKAFPKNLPLFDEYIVVINVDGNGDENLDPFKQQFWFVGLSLLIETAVYILRSRLSQVMSPHYVGQCHFAEYPRFKVSIMFVSAHIVSDVYLGILLTKQAAQ